jgi:drug/metabolite transporter (DMT)-like permease
MTAPRVATWRLQFVALAAIWGASFLFIKVAVEDLPPVAVALGRCVLGAAVLLVVLALRREGLPRDPRVWGHLAVVALLANALPFTLFAAGERHISSVLAGLWNATTPLLTLAVVTLALPEERPTRERVIGLVGGFAGVVIVLGPWSSPGGSQLTGQLLCLGATAGYALAFPYLRRTLSGRPESALALSAGQLVCATALLAVAAPLAGAAPTTVHGDTVAAMLALGVLGTGAAYVLNFSIIRAAGATTAATVTYLIPLFSTVLGIAVLDESLTWNQPAGAVVVLAGVAYSQRRRG